MLLQSDSPFYSTYLYHSNLCALGPLHIHSYFPLYDFRCIIVDVCYRHCNGGPHRLSKTDVHTNTGDCHKGL